MRLYIPLQNHESGRRSTSSRTWAIFFFVLTDRHFLTENSEPVFVNFYGAQEIDSEESILQPMYLAGRYDRKGSRTDPPVWESILGLIKRFTNTGFNWILVRNIGYATITVE